MCSRRECACGSNQNPMPLLWPKQEPVYSDDNHTCQAGTVLSEAGVSMPFDHCVLLQSGLSSQVQSSLILPSWRFLQVGTRHWDTIPHQV